MIPHITQKNIFDFAYSVPPLSEQQAIVEYLDEQTELIDKNIDLESQKITTLKEYRQSLISAVVTGKICVIDN
jgi:type I restriction enzyme S subunit